MTHFREYKLKYLKNTLIIFMSFGIVQVLLITIGNIDNTAACNSININHKMTNDSDLSFQKYSNCMHRNEVRLLMKYYNILTYINKNEIYIEYYLSQNTFNADCKYYLIISNDIDWYIYFVNTELDNDIHRHKINKTIGKKIKELIESGFKSQYDDLLIDETTCKDCNCYYMEISYNNTNNRSYSCDIFDLNDLSKNCIDKCGIEHICTDIDEFHYFTASRNLSILTRCTFESNEINLDEILTLCNEDVTTEITENEPLKCDISNKYIRIANLVDIYMNKHVQKYNTIEN